MSELFRRFPTCHQCLSFSAAHAPQQPATLHQTDCMVSQGLSLRVSSSDLAFSSRDAFPSAACQIPQSTLVVFSDPARRSAIDFGQFQLRPISTPANFWMLNFGPRRVEAQTCKKWGPEGWRPRRVDRRVEAQTYKKWGPEGWRPRRVEGWGPEGCWAQNFAFFSLSRHIFLSFFSLLGVLALNFGGV